MKTKALKNTKLPYVGVYFTQNNNLRMGELYYKLDINKQKKMYTFYNMEHDGEKVLELVLLHARVFECSDDSVQGRIRL